MQLDFSLYRVDVPAEPADEPAPQTDPTDPAGGEAHLALPHGLVAPSPGRETRPVCGPRWPLCPPRGHPCCSAHCRYTGILYTAPIPKGG